MATKKAAKKPAIKKTTKNKSMLNKKGKVSTKTLIIILVIVVVVGVGAIFGIKALSNKKELSGGGMDATIKVTQYRYYKWQSYCGAEGYNYEDPISTYMGWTEVKVNVSNKKFTDKECYDYVNKRKGKIFGSGVDKIEVGFTRATKSSYTSWTTSSAVPSGYSKSNREIRYVNKTTSSQKPARPGVPSSTVK